MTLALFIYKLGAARLGRLSPQQQACQRSRTSTCTAPRGERPPWLSLKPNAVAESLFRHPD